MNNEAKNRVVVNGVRRLQRWTVLDVSEDTVNYIKQYAKENGLTTGRALEKKIGKPRKRQ